MMVCIHVGAAALGREQTPELRRLKPLPEQVPKAVQRRLFLFGPLEEKPRQRIAKSVAPAAKLHSIPWMGPLFEIQDDLERIERVCW